MSNVGQHVADQALAFDAIPSAWPGLSHDDRHDVIDLCSTYDFGLAYDYLLTSPTLDPKFADRLRKRSAVLAG